HSQGHIYSLSADEIFDCVKENLTEYKKGIECLKQENYCLRRRICSCAETCHVKLEFANHEPHEPLSQASFNTSPLSDGVSGQECGGTDHELHNNSYDSFQGDLESFQGVLRRFAASLFSSQNERPFCCGLCGSRFKSKYTLKEHERIHKGDYRYSCPKCGRGFSLSNHVRNHLKAARCLRSSSSRK
uniref:C2H2-type domain-containing protein n=1 Tax=Sinocyclocheilus grahami TaxID=75366 RepID=A0A672M5I7_SINGR